MHELKLTIILFAICLGYATISWFHSLIKHLDASRDFHHSDMMFFGLGIGVLLMTWACTMRYVNYRKLRKDYDDQEE